jgi:vancomycin permeability regulator SanA
MTQETETITPARRSRVWWLCAGTALLLIAGCAYLGAIAAAGLAAQPEHGDLIIVLGNEVLADGSPSPRLAARLDCALDAHKQGLAPYFFVSGGRGLSGFDEGVVMRDYLVARGIAEDHIIVDLEGINSHATARNAALVMHEHGWHSAIVVSQYFHVFRARMACHIEGIAFVSTAAPWYFELRDLYSLAREGAALPVYAIRHWLDR